MTDDQLYSALQRMEQYGGGFASTIAVAYYRADSFNRAKLLAAFGDLIEQFIPATEKNA